MSNTMKCLTVAALVLGALTWARYESNTANEDFDFALTTDWTSGEHAGKWEPVVGDEEPEEASMDDVFHAAIAPRQSRTASASEVIR